MCPPDVRWRRAVRTTEPVSTTRPDFRPLSPTYSFWVGPIPLSCTSVTVVTSRDGVLGLLSDQISVERRFVSRCELGSYVRSHFSSVVPSGTDSRAGTFDERTTFG